MPDREKIEPFWRPARVLGRRKTPAAEPVSATTPLSARKSAPASAVPDPDPSSSARREAIGALISGEWAATQPAATDDSTPGKRARKSGRSWVQLTAREAATHPLYGAGGWLVVVAFLLCLGLLRALVEILDFWAVTGHGGMAAWVMAVLRSTMALWSALILGLLLGCSRAFPANLAAYASVDFLYLALFGLAFAHLTQGAILIGIGVSIALTLLMLAYVTWSKRANVTYRHRVRARDPWLAKRARAAPPA